MTGSGGFWDRVDAWFRRFEEDDEYRARVLTVVWWVSVGFVVFGFVVILWILVGGDWPPQF